MRPVGTCTAVTCTISSSITLWMTWLGSILWLADAMRVTTKGRGFMRKRDEEREADTSLHTTSSSSELPLKRSPTHGNLARGPASATLLDAVANRLGLPKPLPMGMNLRQGEVKVATDDLVRINGVDNLGCVWWLELPAGGVTCGCCA